MEKKNAGKEEKTIKIGRKVSAANDEIADDILRTLTDKGAFCINIMGSPGSGKTTVIEGLARFISPSEIAVIQGDLESDIDKRRMESSGIYAYQINTHSGCHLNARMVSDAIADMQLSGKKYLLIENVGNLVCPAGVNLGQHMNIVVSSTTEGSDKPGKYPIIFMDADMVIISKLDLKDAAGFDEKGFTDEITRLNSRARIFKTSSREQGSFRPAAEFIIQRRDYLISKRS